MQVQSAARAWPTPKELYTRFRAGEAGFDPDHLAYLDKGIDTSPCRDQIPAYPKRLAQTSPAPAPGAASFPTLGQLPNIENKLDFLDPSITNACVCLGSVDGARWLGRNATEPTQMWSSTKMLPMTRVAELVNQASPQTRLENCQIKDAGSPRTIAVTQAYDNIVSYRQGGSASNSQAKMLKQFDTPAGLEGWLHALTGNAASVFRGGYGEPAFIESPTLVDNATHKEVLHASGQQHKGSNLVGAYDLCRVMGMVGWHDHLPAAERVPHLLQSGDDSLVRGLGTDSARFVDVSLEALGIKDRVDDLVVMSKLGFGRSDATRQWQECYTAFVSFLDKETGQPHQLAMSLKGAHDNALDLDAHMASSVATILERVLSGELGNSPGA